MTDCHQWVRWILMCVEIVDYSVIVNNEDVEPIISRTGLRHGCPLSAYLFILCSEGLSALVQRSERIGDLHDISICTDAPVISNLCLLIIAFFFLGNTNCNNPFFTRIILLIIMCLCVLIYFCLYLIWD